MQQKNLMWNGLFEAHKKIMIFEYMRNLCMDGLTKTIIVNI
jgi:hypothetical protein